MTTLYICGPMTGLPGLNFPAFFDADSKLQAAGYETLNPADRAGRTVGKPWDWYLRRCIKDVVEADGLALLPGWRGSRGALLEVHIAGELFIPALEVQTWLDVPITNH